MVLPIIGLGVSALLGGAVSVLAFGPGFGDLITQNMYYSLQSRILQGVDLVRALKKGHITREQFNEKIKYAGYAPDEAELLVKSSLEKLSVSEILTLWFRYRHDENNPYQIDSEWLTKSFDAAGMDTGIQDQIIEANRPIPPLDDIIRFAVRDVYEPEQARLAGLFEDIPQEFIQEANKRGLKPEDTAKYWASHWYIPSTNQMIEMSQRLFDHPDPEVKFDQQDMLAGFKLADIAPAFRKRLLAISKHPIGRVDIRRFDAMGVFGEGEERQEKLTRRYLELGYNEADAKLQTEFTIKLNDSREESGSAAEVLRFYREGVFRENKRDTATTMLLARGLPEDRVKLLLDFEDMKIIDQEEQDQINRVKDQWLNGTLEDESSLRNALNKIELTTTDLNKLVDKFIRLKEQDTKRMTLSQADKLRRLELIDRKTWFEIYKQRGIYQPDIDKLDKLFDYEEKATERAPSKDDVLSWYESNLIDDQEFILELTSLGYKQRYIQLYALGLGREITFDEVS